MGAELKCMYEVERKQPGTHTKGLGEKTSDRKGFDTDRMAIKEDVMSYVIGKEASTQMKIEKAAGCILIMVGCFAMIAGDLKERRRCRDYLGWLLKQLNGSVTVRDANSRDDCTEMYIPANCKGWVMGNRGQELRRVEKEGGVFTFMALDDRGEERLLILAADPGSKSSDTGRAAAERMVNDMIQAKLRDDDGHRGRSDSRPRNSGRNNRGRSDSRRPPPRRSPPRRRTDSRGPPPRRSSPPRRSDSRRRNSPPPRRDVRDPPPRSRNSPDYGRRKDSRDR